MDKDKAIVYPEKYPASVMFVSMEEARAAFEVKKLNEKAWLDSIGKQLATIQVFNQRNGTPNKYLDLCYLKSGDGHSPKTDVWGYITTNIN